MIEIHKVEDVIVSTQFLCNLLNVSDRTLTTYKRNGCPQIKYGKWNLKEVLNWYYNYKNMSNNDIDKRKIINNEITDKNEAKELIGLLLQKL